MDRQKLLTENYDLIVRCVECQLAKQPMDLGNKDDLIQDIALWFLTYDEKKLQNAIDNNHLNALITSVVVKQIFSKNSPYYKHYKKFAERSDEITSEILNIADEEN